MGFGIGVQAAALASKSREVLQLAVRLIATL